MTLGLKTGQSQLSSSAATGFLGFLGHGAASSLRIALPIGHGKRPHRAALVEGVVKSPVTATRRQRAPEGKYNTWVAAEFKQRGDLGTAVGTAPSLSPPSSAI